MDLFYTLNLNKIKIFSSPPMRLCICRNCLLWKNGKGEPQDSEEGVKKGVDRISRHWKELWRTYVGGQIWKHSWPWVWARKNMQNFLKGNVNGHDLYLDMLRVLSPGRKFPWLTVKLSPWNSSVSADNEALQQGWLWPQYCVPDKDNSCARAAERHFQMWEKSESKLPKCRTWKYKSRRYLELAEKLKRRILNEKDETKCPQETPSKTQQKKWYYYGFSY